MLMFSGKSMILCKLHQEHLLLLTFLLHKVVQW